MWAVIAIGLSACYEQAPRSGPLAHIADSLLPQQTVAWCRSYHAELPGEPTVHTCTGGRTAVLVDRWGRVQRVIRHEGPGPGGVLDLYNERARQLATTLGAGQRVCFGEDGRGPMGRQWSSPEYTAYVTMAVDTTEVELVFALGRPRFGSSCLGA